MTILPRRRPDSRGRGLPPAEPLAPSGIAAPLATATQDQMRERRHRRQRVHYGSTFNLAAEVQALCGPVAHETSRVPHPVALRSDVEAVADAVHEVLSVAVGLIAADRHQSSDARARTRQAAADLAVTGTLGYIHASPALVAAASAANLVQRSGTGLTTPPGHKWVFGGGYVDGLDAVLVATSPTFGWRDQVAVRDTMKVEHNLFVAIAERSLLVGYEAAIGAAEIMPPAP